MKDIFSSMFVFFEYIIWKIGRYIKGRYFLATFASSVVLILTTFILYQIIKKAEFIFALISTLIFFIMFISALGIIIRVLSNKIDRKYNKKD